MNRKASGERSTLLPQCCRASGHPRELYTGMVAVPGTARHCTTPCRKSSFFWNRVKLPVPSSKFPQLTCHRCLSWRLKSCHSNLQTCMGLKLQVVIPRVLHIFLPTRIRKHQENGPNPLVTMTYNIYFHLAINIFRTVLCQTIGVFQRSKSLSISLWWYRGTCNKAGFFHLLNKVINII